MRVGCTGVSLGPVGPPGPTAMPSERWGEERIICSVHSTVIDRIQRGNGSRIRQGMRTARPLPLSPKDVLCTREGRRPRRPCEKARKISRTTKCASLEGGGPPPPLCNGCAGHAGVWVSKNNSLAESHEQSGRICSSPSAKILWWTCIPGVGFANTGLSC